MQISGILPALASTTPGTEGGHAFARGRAAWAWQLANGVVRAPPSSLPRSAALRRRRCRLPHLVFPRRSTSLLKHASGPTLFSSFLSVEHGYKAYPNANYLKAASDKLISGSLLLYAFLPRDS